MNRFDWKSLSRLQLGRFAEYFVKMEFTMCGFDIYSPEIDDKGIDFVIRTVDGKYWEVQVKSLHKSSNVYLNKAKFDVSQSNLLVALVRLRQDEEPIIYLLRSSLWNTPNGLFVGYDRQGYSEWAIQISKKNEALLAPYLFEKIVQTL